MKSLKTTARLTGLGYLIIFITGFFANFYTLESMVVDGHGLLTAVNITNRISQFQIGLIAFSIMVLVDIILAFPLYRLLKNENEGMAITSAILRILNGTIFAVALFSLFDIASLAIKSPQELAGNVVSLLAQFNMVWNIGLLFFGVHLIMLGLLIFRSVNFPRIVGIFLQVAGLGYFADSGAQLFLSNYQDYKGVLEIIVISGGVIGEFSLTLFLLIKGLRFKKSLTPQLAT